MKNKILFTGFYLLLCVLGAGAQNLKLNSYPAAAATIYLDFDGEEVNSPVWNGGNTIVCAASGLNNIQITEVFNRMSEDFRPFAVNITTDEDVFAAAPFDKRMRVIVTPTSSWFTGAGGISYLGSFTWGDDTPCFVFCDRLGPNNPKMVAECCSHESGHTLGLSHQSTYDNNCHLTATYNEGAGTGETGWAPIMGNSYNRNMSGWNNGPTPYGCSNNQDNLSILTSRNGFGYRTDDFGDDIHASPAAISAANSYAEGIIGTSSDKDAFTFSLSHNTNFHLEAIPYSVGAANSGANLDIKLTLFDAAKNPVRIYNPAESMSVLIDTLLNAGTYYLLLEGTGNSNTTGYGSLGSYKLTGLFSVLPVCNITLSGVAEKNLHQLNWHINCNETISTVTLQSSVDGIRFMDIRNVTGQTSFACIPAQKADTYYRLQVQTRSGNIVVSSTLLLRKANDENNFVVPTLITDAISVTASCPFSYVLSGENGVLLASGKGQNGLNSIPVSKFSSGMYILSLLGCGEKQTVRVFKL